MRCLCCLIGIRLALQLPSLLGKNSALEGQTRSRSIEHDLENDSQNDLGARHIAVYVSLVLVAIQLMPDLRLAHLSYLGGLDCVIVASGGA